MMWVSLPADHLTHQLTWLDAGRPVDDVRHVALDARTGIVDYTPGDLTLTARAGTTLAEIAAATAANGQCLALAPWGGDAGSLGATAATARVGAEASTAPGSPAGASTFMVSSTPAGARPKSRTGTAGCPRQ